MMTDLIFFLFGALLGFAGGWLAYRNWGAKVKAAEAAALAATKL
jgi:hypothetical protein